MRHVAEVSGVSTATIYRHFPSKPRLVLAVFGRCLEEFDAIHAVGPITVTDPRQRLQQLVGDLFAALYPRRLLADAAARAYALADESATGEVEGVRLHLTDLFAEALGGEDFTPEDAAIGSLLCDVWLSGMVRISQCRITLPEFQRRLSAAVDLVTTEVGNQQAQQHHQLRSATRMRYSENDHSRRWEERVDE